MSELIINVAVSHLSLLTARTLYTQTDHINRTVIKGCSNGPTRGRACSPQEPLVGVPHGPLRLSTHGCLRLVNYGYPQRARLSRSRVAPGHKNASHIHSHGRNELQASNWKKKLTHNCVDRASRDHLTHLAVTPHVPVTSSVQQRTGTGTIIYLINHFFFAPSSAQASVHSCWRRHLGSPRWVGVNEIEKLPFAAFYWRRKSGRYLT